jgi:hypothetical protein
MPLRLTVSTGTHLIRPTPISAAKPTAEPKELAVPALGLPRDSSISLRLYVSTLEAVPSAMILRTTVSEAKTAPAVVMAPAGATPFRLEPPMTTAP